MASSAPIVRKKRNFKALQLDVTKSAEPAPVAPLAKAVDPIPTRNPPPAQTNGRRRPAPITLVAPKLSVAPANDDNNLLTISSRTPNSAPISGTVSATRPTYHTDLSQKLAKMDMNVETKYDLRTEDLKELQELGQGNGGSVKKVQHVPTGKTMAKKASIQLEIVLHYRHFNTNDYIFAPDCLVPLSLLSDLSSIEVVN